MTCEEANVFDVIVVGAGIAGLQAARDLADSSDDKEDALNVVLLESNDYVGGR